MADLAAENHEVTVNILRHSTRQGVHEYLIELFEGERLVIGGVTVDSATELTVQEVFDRAIKQYFLPTFEAE